MSNKLKIVFIQTGGTIDKDYPHATKGWAFEFGTPAFNRILEKLNPSFDFEVLSAFQKDSLEITDEDRDTLANLILASKDDKFIVTHGTDTMFETASFLNERLKNKLIIITGAMRPERFSNSDAAINLGAAIAATNLIASGVFIAMHGIVKSWEQMKRDMQTGKYY